jgi:hypothetical protein
MIIKFEGRDWEFDSEEITLQQAMTIQLHTGMSIGEWEDSLNLTEDADGNVQNPGPEWLKSLQCVYWLMKAQNGEKNPVADADFVLAKFLVAFGEGMQAEVTRLKAEKAAEEAAADPTPPPSPPAGPPSPEPGYPTATTLQPLVREEPTLATA